MTGPTPGPTPQRGGPTQNLNTGQPLRGNATGGQTGGPQPGPDTNARSERAGQRAAWNVGFKAGLSTGKELLFRSPPTSGVGKSVAGIARQKPKAQAQTVWSPDPSSVLFLGLTLVGTNFIVRGQIGQLWDSIWNVSTKVGQSNAKFPTFPTTAGLFGEILFIFVLYVLATISPTLARAITIFLFGLWFIFLLFYGPKIATFFAPK